MEIKRLTPTSVRTAVEQAKREVLIEREGKQLGLKTNWKSLNIAVRKYFRFASVYLLGGLSGSGKSYIANLIINDFFDKELNKDFTDAFMVLSFSFEMASSDEVLRTASNQVKISYNRFINSEWDKEKKEYVGLSDEEKERSFEALDKIANRPQLFFEHSGTTLEMIQTVDYYSKKYPDTKFVITLDHSLLTRKHNEGSDIELVGSIGKMALFFKKEYKAMVIIINQLNNSIESSERIRLPALHYPIRSDLYLGNFIYFACDLVIIVHQPALLKIKLYGLKKIPTKNLIHLMIQKNRFGQVGSIWLINQLSKGLIVEKKSIEILDLPKDVKKDDVNFDNK